MLFFLAGAALVGLGVGLLRNTAGLQDWWLSAAQNRYRIMSNGFWWRPPTRAGVTRTGWMQVLLGLGFLLAGFSLV